MMKLFRRFRKQPAVPQGALGADTLARRCTGGEQVAPGCIGFTFGKAGVISRLASGARFAAGSEGFCFHPGPYETAFAPFAAAPELGLQISFLIDSADPRVAQQRFDLYLVSEIGEGLTLAAFNELVAATVQRELAQGSLDLPPCTTTDEWNDFRAGLNRILYQRFGITVEDCLPVDLGERVDYAQQLRTRVIESQPAPVTHVEPAVAPARTDALALRRLFLELPALASALRQVVLPEGQGLFAPHQQLLQRLDHVALGIDTMPALDLAGPGRPLDALAQEARARHSAAAAQALDEAWSLAGRLATAPAELLDEADRIVANLELHCAARRATP